LVAQLEPRGLRGVPIRHEEISRREERERQHVERNFEKLSKMAADGPRQPQRKNAPANPIGSGEAIAPKG
jgi:hypothetical protein